MASRPVRFFFEMSEWKKMSNVIAIDGPAASGKSTVARMLAERFGIAYVNTGSLYRAVAYAALRGGMEFSRLDRDFLAQLQFDYAPDENGAFTLRMNGVFLREELRSPEVAAGASAVATLPVVREALLDVQRSMAGERMIVMEGRDIGTVVFPDARYKFFVTATPEERARRRLAQSGEVAAGATLEEVAREIAARDKQDSERKTAPLKPAEDAIRIDTTGRTIAEVVEMIAAYVK